MKCMWIFVNTFGSVRRALGRHLDPAAAHLVAAALEDQHHVVGGAAAGAGQHGLHRPRRQVAAAAVGRAVHRQHVAAAGLGARTPCRSPAASRSCIPSRPQPPRDIARAAKNAPTTAICIADKRYTAFHPSKRMRDVASSTGCLLHLLHWWIQPRPQARGFFLGRRAVGIAAPATSPRMMRLPNRRPPETTTGMATPTARPKQRACRRSPLTLADYLQKILTARVYDVAVESPLEPRRRLSARLGNRVCSSARTSSRCSASSCAAPTTRWRTSRPSSCGAA